MKRSYVYILTNPRKTVLYTGVTSNLGKQVFEHKNRVTEGLTRQYHCHELVYYEITDDLETAKERQKEIKAECRLIKEKRIETFNPEWEDLSPNLLALKRK